MRNKDFNSIFLNISRQGIAYPLNSLKSVIDSDYSPEFNPFTNYFEGNARWDRKTDHIRKLADTIQAGRSGVLGRDSGGGSWPWWPRPSDRAKQTKKHWCCTEHRGKEKSTWIRHLLPPELAEYYRNGMIDPANKDDLLLLSTRLLINMEEFEGVKTGTSPN